MSDDKKWDWKQLGIGGGSTLLALFAFQDKGIELMNKNQLSENQVVIEKTIANANRISRLEQNVANLNAKIDRGFDSVRDQIRADTGKLGDIVRAGTQDRFTKSEHISFRSEVQGQIQRMQDQINLLRDRIDSKYKK